MVAASIAIGLILVAGWQVWVHSQLDRRISECDPSLLSSVSHKVETSIDSPAGSMVVPYVPIQLAAITGNQVMQPMLNNPNNHQHQQGNENQPMLGSGHQ